MHEKKHGDSQETVIMVQARDDGGSSKLSGGHLRNTLLCVAFKC